MDKFWAALAVAIVVGFAGLAVKHPDVFRKLLYPIGMAMLAALMLVFGWNTGLTGAAKIVSEHMPKDPAEGDTIIKAIEAADIDFKIVVGAAAAIAAAIGFLAWLSDEIASKKKQDDKD